MDTKLFVRQTPGGLFAIKDAAECPGSIFWVGSGVTGATDGTGYGSNPDVPFATLDYAIGQCTANKHDVIYVLPGHAETITAADGINVDVAGVTIIGLGAGEKRPTITFTTSNDATFGINAANVTVKGLLFKNDKDGQTTMVDVDAADATVEACEFREGSSKQAVTHIDVNGGAANAADRCVIRGCTFIGPTAGATGAIELGEVADGVVIEDNYIFGDWSDAGIHNPTGKILTNLRIDRNVIRNNNSGEHAIELVSACTGMASDNRLYGDTLGTIFDSGALMCNGNLETDAVDQSGIPSPSSASAGSLPAGSIGTTTFAAGAINAAAIATDAIDADAVSTDACQEIAATVRDTQIGTSTAGTIGEAIRPIGNGTAQAGAAGTITLAAASSATNNLYNGCAIQIYSGTGAAQLRIITAYDGATKIATIAPNWATNPANDSKYVIMANGTVRVDAFTAGIITAAAIATDAIDADALAADAVAEIADGVTDEAVSGHVTAGTVGAMVQPMTSGTAQAGAAGTITLAAAASATNNLYNGGTIQVIAGTGVGQSRIITAYDGATKIATIAPNWATNPANDSVYVIHPVGSVRVDAFTAGTITAAAIATDAVDADALAADAVAEIADGIADEAVSGHRTAGTVGAMLQPLDTGTAQAGAAGTITLAATASATNNLYNGNIIQVIAGTGIGQSRVITGYAGATKIADVAPNWATNPANDSVYVILACGSTRVDAFTAGVVNAAAIADAAIDIATLAADAKTSLKAITQVVKAGGTLEAAGADNIFDITVGRVLVHGLVGEVTTVCQAAAAATKMQFTSTATTDTTDLCGNLDLDSAKDGALLGISGVAADAMVKGYGKMCSEPFVLDAGTVKMYNAGAANSGVIAWTMYYTALDTGATVAASA